MAKFARHHPEDKRENITRAVTWMRHMRRKKQKAAAGRAEPEEDEEAAEDEAGPAGGLIRIRWEIVWGFSVSP